MAYHDELLELANHLAHIDPPGQATLRRSASTAYYAVFHLLIDATIANWNRDNSRQTLGRMFDHGLMDRVSKRTQDSASFQGSNAKPEVISDLQHVARAFCELQKKRHSADYELSKRWERTETLAILGLCQNAFEAWNRIRDEDLAQEYLVKLLIRPRD